MDHHGEQFGVDLFKLWECGTIDLPAFAGRMVEAADVLVGVDSSGVWVGGGAGTQRLMSSWMRLGDNLRTAMATSVANIYATCDALIQIANNYAETDAAASGEFTRRCADEVYKHASDRVPIVFDTPANRPRIITVTEGPS